MFFFMVCLWGICEIVGGGIGVIGIDGLFLCLCIIVVVGCDVVWERGGGFFVGFSGFWGIIVFIMFMCFMCLGGLIGLILMVVIGVGGMVWFILFMW